MEKPNEARTVCHAEPQRSISLRGDKRPFATAQGDTALVRLLADFSIRLANNRMWRFYALDQISSWLHVTLIHADEAGSQTKEHGRTAAMVHPPRSPRRSGVGRAGGLPSALAPRPLVPTRG